jgi:hypothetical protein
MFNFLKPGKGYAITFANGRRVEVDFGPMSRSEKKNSSQKECDHSPASRNAEIRVYMPGETMPSLVRANCTAEEFADILYGKYTVD